MIASRENYDETRFSAPDRDWWLVSFNPKAPGGPWAWTLGRRKIHKTPRVWAG